MFKRVNRNGGSGNVLVSRSFPIGGTGAGLF
jgi:hypothetical protein